MCEFKYCRGTGTCFLSKTSPCSGFNSEAPEARPQSRPRSVRVSYAGFLDHDELVDILEMADEPRVEQPAPRGLFGRAPRFLQGSRAKNLARTRSVA